MISSSQCVVAVALFAASIATPAVAATIPDDTTRTIAPGDPGVRPFWNAHSRRFIYAPAFDLPAIEGAASYRFTIVAADGNSTTFTADRPTAALSPVWNAVPEGVTTLRVEALDAAGQVVKLAGERTFYRSPGFSGVVDEPLRPYDEAARDGLRAIFQAPNVQHWLTHGQHDRTYRLYNYPNKVMGGVIRAMAAYAQVAKDEADRAAALTIGRRVGDHLINLRLPADVPYAHVPPTYSLDVDKPFPVTKNRVKNRWLMVTSAIDAAFGFLDLHDVTGDAKYLDAATAIADTLAKTQEADGTWPLMIDWKTGDPVAPQRLIPTWIIFFFDRLDRQYELTQYREPRARAWTWIERNPLRTYQWDGQFEDVALWPPYANLSREQACDVAVLLLSEPNVATERVAQAEDLLRFAEDQFVIWTPVKDPKGFDATTKRSDAAAVFLPPCVLEQYHCYAPVARSSAVQIAAYLKAHVVTKNETYLAKARALANGLVTGQAWASKAHNAGGEIPTWIMTDRYLNWLNNSFYAADAVRNVAAAGR